MSLTIGDKLGSYEVLSPLGAGGMGEVYRAHDTKLGREVAIKVLPEEFSEHPEKLARFEREARLLAALNHPKIATLYSVEEFETKPFLVMELVEGETLADRIARGPIRFEEALIIAHQITEALEAAHEKGVIHRDLKPANIKVDAEGNVKVLDFGLAKAFAGDDEAQAELSQSPTLSRDATRAGAILGTAAYMSPEQAKGKNVDKRVDIFSFGIVLYEMLTARKAFAGEDAPEVLAGIINREPDWAPVDPRVQHLLRRCLRKDRKNRLRDIGDARNEIEELLMEPEAASAAGGQRLSTPTAIAAASLLCGVVAVAVWLLKPEQERRRPIVRVVATPPSAEPVDVAPFATDVDLAITPDGTRIVYPVAVNGRRKLVVRALDQLETTPLTEFGNAPNAAHGPFISPDGNWVGYFDGTATLRKVSILGGPPVVLCELPEGAPRGASWGPDDNIIFATTGPKGLLRVAASGGTPEELTTPDARKGDHLWPEILPGGKAVLFAIMNASADDAQIAVLSLATGKIKVLIRGGSNPRFAPTGHIVYGVGGALRAVGFDRQRLEVTSNPVPVLEHVVTKATGSAEFDISNDGSLVYLAGRDPEGWQNKTLVWVDREGREQSLAAPPRNYAYPRISPDGRQVALDLRDQDDDIWIWDFDRETLRRLTFAPERDRYPAWTPDGRRIAFASTRNGGLSNLFWKAADGTGTVERLTESDSYQFAYAFSPDGKRLLYSEAHPERQRDLLLRSMDANGASEPLVATEFTENNGELSPNGRWLAYQSDASGQFEVYVRPFPDVDDGSWQISRGGGTRPLWARTGRELFYLDSSGRLTSVSVRTEPSIDFGNPATVIEKPYGGGSVGRNYDVSPDGKRFLMIEDSPAGHEASSAALILVQNWFEELKRLVPTN